VTFREFVLAGENTLLTLLRCAIIALCEYLPELSAVTPMLALVSYSQRRVFDLGDSPIFIGNTPPMIRDIEEVEVHG
jgi:hypothetical protein